MRIKNKSQLGIGLIEVIVALGIAIIVITALVSLSVVTLRASLSSNLLLQGSKRASEELELVRAFRDKSLTWSDFRTAVTNCANAPCHIVSSGGTLSVTYAAEGIGSGVTKITRYFQVSDPVGSNGIVDATDNLLRISVSSSWSIGSLTKYAHVYTDLSNWRNN